jgi:hypothetical protein
MFYCNTEVKQNKTKQEQQQRTSNMEGFFLFDLNALRKSANTSYYCYIVFELTRSGRESALLQYKLWYIALRFC